MDITLEILGIFPSVINDSLYIRIEDDIYYNLAKCINQKLQINFHLLKNIEIFKQKKKQNKINICLCTKNKKTFNELAKTDLDPFNETKWITLSNYKNKKKFNTFRLNIKMISIPHKQKKQIPSSHNMNNSMQFNGNDSFLNDSIISNNSSNTNIFNNTLNGNYLNNISINSDINNNSVMNNIVNNNFLNNSLINGNINNFSLINNKNKLSNNSLIIKSKTNDKKNIKTNYNNNKLNNNNTTKNKKIIKSEVNKNNFKNNKNSTKKTFTSAKNVPKINKPKNTNKFSSSKNNNIFFTPLDLNKKIFNNMIVKSNNKNIINNNDKIIEHINNTEILNDLSIIDKFEKDNRIDFSNTNNNTSFEENLFSEDTEFSKRNSRKIDDLINFNSNLSYKEKYLQKKNDFFLLYDKNFFKNLKNESFENLKLESNLIFDKILEIFLSYHLVVKYKNLKQKKYFINYKLNSEYYFSLKKIYLKFKQFKEKFSYKNNLSNNKKNFNPNENKIYLNEFNIIKSIKLKNQNEKKENKNKLKNIFNVLFKKNKFFVNNEFNKLLSKKYNNYLNKFINVNKNNNNKNIKKSHYKNIKNNNN